MSTYKRFWILSWLVGLGLLIGAIRLGWSQQYSFINYSGDHGLSQLSGEVLFQDRDGYIWVGTQAGLNRFNGESFETTSIRDGLANDYITAIVQDADGTLWIGTWGGLSRLDHSGIFNYSIEAGLPSRLVKTLAIDKNGILWCGTASGLCRFDKKKFYQFTPNDGLPNTVINTILIDHKDWIWVGTDQGLFFSQDQGKKFQAFPYPRLEDQVVRCLAQDKQHFLWVVTNYSVLVFSGENFLVQYSTDDGIEGIPIRSIYVGQDDTVWLGTNEEIVFIEKTIPGWSLQFIRKNNGLPLHDLRCIIEDREGTLWIGGFGGVSTLKGRMFTYYTTADGLGSDVVRPIIRSQRGELWAGTEGGLGRLAPQIQIFRNYTHEDGLNHRYIQALMEDDKGNIWIGNSLGVNYFDGKKFLSVPEIDLYRRGVISLTQGKNGTIWLIIRGIGLFKKEKERFEAVTVPGQMFSAACVRQDQQENIWVSGDNGLSRWDGKQWKTFTTRDGLPSNQPYFIAIDHTGFVWCGFHGSNGLSVYDGSVFTTYTTRDGLFHDAVYSLGVDRDNNMWLGTAQGVDKWVRKTREFINYATPEGYPSNESNSHGFWADPDGSLWFGTAKGLAHYHPRYDVFRDVPPLVKIVELDFSGIPGSLPLKKGFSLPYSRNDLHATIICLSSVSKNRLFVRYRLVGYDSSWHILESRQITYANLAPGTYQLELQGRKYRQDWSKSVVTEFTIRPPYWQTWWFRLLIAIFLLTLLWSGYKIRVHRIQAKSKKLEAIIDQRTLELQHAMQHANQMAQAAENANRAKSEFLARMSHEIRTPMNGVLGMATVLLSTNLEKDQRDYVDTIKKSGEALITVINDILDFSKIEAGKLELYHTDFRLRELLADTIKTLQTRAGKENLVINWSVTEDVPENLEGDPDRLRQILVNLVGNAIKFTQKGAVMVQVNLDHLEAEKGWIKFQVSDTGIGIPAEKQSIIFDAFAQADSSTTRHYGGTGLGLAITSQLVELMDGKIGVESPATFSFPAHIQTSGPGSTFTFTIRLKILAMIPESRKKSGPFKIPRDIKLMARDFIQVTGRQPHLLLAEDNPINQKVAEYILKRMGCQVTIATNGKEAVEKYERDTFDMILMDVQMPEMNGLDATDIIRQLEKRKNQNLHIPIIALTAHALKGDRERCIEAGMDDYLSKPLQASILVEKVNHFLFEHLPPKKDPIVPV